MNDILDETKDFKQQITLIIKFKKYQTKKEIEFSTIYFNSTTKTVINHKFGLDKSFQEILCWIDNWANEGSCWIVK